MGPSLLIACHPLPFVPPDLQRGFVPGRQILQNVLQLDTQSRVYALRCQSERKTRNLSALVPPDQVGKLAILALFDFVCAFPKTSHKWMFMVIERIGMPEYLRNIVHSIHHDCADLSMCMVRV